MMLQAADFARFFHAVHCDDPFRWQQALVDQLAADDCWPDVLDLPTGAGKTAALDAAVFHLALRADEPQRAALRIVLVVDRRLVVDDAYHRARKIECALGDPSGPRRRTGPWSRKCGDGCYSSPATTAHRWSRHGCAAARPWSTTGRAPLPSRPFSALPSTR